MTVAQFTRDLLDWYSLWGRHSLVWKDSGDNLPREQRAYYTLVSEIMLQQTQVSRVTEYFPIFISNFPDIVALAEADIDQVLYCWQGLGYYRRARHLHQCARLIAEQHHGRIPQTAEELYSMPGIGKSTAHAILAQTDNQRLAILDANVIRVLSRLHAITEDTSQAKTRAQLWRIAEQLTPQQSRDYTQAIMDFGALICTSNPDCHQCFANSYCQAYSDKLVEQIPRRKKTQRRRLRLFYLLVTINGQLLLQQRKQFSIWQGMWALPEFTSLASLRMFAHNHRLQIQTRGFQKLKWLLTHRELGMHSIPASAEQATIQVREDNICYVHTDQLKTIALAPPFIQLLKKHGIALQ